jgi:hypothetical protein
MSGFFSSFILLLLFFFFVEPVVDASASANFVAFVGLNGLQWTTAEISAEIYGNFGQVF